MPNSLRPNSLAPWAESLNVKDCWSQQSVCPASYRTYSGRIDGHSSRVGRGVWDLAWKRVLAWCSLRPPNSLTSMQLQRLKVLGQFLGHDVWWYSDCKGGSRILHQDTVGCNTEGSGYHREESRQEEGRGGIIYCTRRSARHVMPAVPRVCGSRLLPQLLV